MKLRSDYSLKRQANGRAELQLLRLFQFGLDLESDQGLSPMSLLRLVPYHHQVTKQPIQFSAYGLPSRLVMMISSTGKVSKAWRKMD